MLQNRPIGRELVSNVEEEIMTEILGFMIIKKAEYPAWIKAHKLARTMTEDQVDDILAGRKHVHGNPKRKAIIGGAAVGGVYPAAGE